MDTIEGAGTLNRVNGIHDHELAYFVDSLTSHQRVYLQRLLGEFLTSFPAEGEDPHPDWYSLHRLGAKTLFTLVDHLRRYENDDSDSDIRPYALSIPEPGHAVIRLSRRFLTWNGLWESSSHAWVADVKVGRLSVDLEQVDDLTSSAIAWLVTLAGQVPERKVRLLNASGSILRSLHILRLDSMLVPVCA